MMRRRDEFSVDHDVNREKSHLELSHVSGVDLDDCWVLAHASRNPEQTNWDEVDSYVLHLRDGGVEVAAHAREGACITSMWVSPMGRIYVAVLSKLEEVLPNGLWVGERQADGSFRFSAPPEGARAHGVRGSSEDEVYCWGGLTSYNEEFVAHFDGRRWERWTSPGDVNVVAGNARSALFAGGAARGGGPMIARWDGTKWSEMHTPAPAPVRCLLVDGPERAYAGGAGFLLVGSEHGWSERLVLERHEIVQWLRRWNDEIWLGTGIGLARLTDDGLLLPEKGMGPIRGLEAGKVLLVAEDDRLHQTADGETFETILAEDIAEAVGLAP